MKRLIFILIFFISSISIFSINNEAMLNYIVKSSGGQTSRADAQRIINAVTSASQKYNFPEAYIYGIIETESNFRNLKANSADARGVMQVTPGTSAKQVGCTGDLYNIEYNIECGVKYFAWLRQYSSHFGIKNLSDMAASYNCGPGCFKSGRWSRIKETTNYIKRVPTYGNKIASVAGLPPLDMSEFPQGMGVSTTEVSDPTIKSDFSDVYFIDFDKGIEHFKKVILDGANKLIRGIIGILILMILIDFVLTAVMESTINPSLILPKMIDRLIKYVFYIGVVLNFIKIQEIMFEFFIGLGKIFGVDTSSANQVWSSFMKEAEKLFNLVVSWHSLEFNTKWELMGELFILLIGLLLLLLIAIRTVIEVCLAIIQFFIVTTMAVFFVPFDVFDKKKIVGLRQRLPITFLCSGLKITSVTITISIILGILSSLKITEVTEIQNINDGYEEIFKYIGVMLIGMILLIKNSLYINKFFSN